MSALYSLKFSSIIVGRSPGAGGEVKMGRGCFLVTVLRTTGRRFGAGGGRNGAPTGAGEGHARMRRSDIRWRRAGGEGAGRRTSAQKLASAVADGVRRRVEVGGTNGRKHTPLAGHCVYAAHKNGPWLARLCGPGSYPLRSDKTRPVMRMNT